MHRLLVDFIRLLREEELAVTLQESVEAARVLELVGYADRDQLKLALGLVLAKDAAEKDVHDLCFERFFAPWQAAALTSAPASAVRQAAGAGVGAGADAPADGMDSGRPERIAGHDFAAGAGAGGLGGGPTLERSAAGPDEDRGWPAQLPSLARLLSEGRPGELELALQQAAIAADLEQRLRYATQRGYFSRALLRTLGMDELRRLLREPGSWGLSAAQAAQLERQADALERQVRALVERQLLIRGGAASRQLREDRLRHAALSAATAPGESGEQVAMQELVRRLAVRLVRRFRRRLRRRRSGMLDLGRSLRRAMASDGVLFDLVWRRRRPRPMAVVAVCDVSASVGGHAGFFLSFLYHLHEVLPKVRSFVFSSHLGEMEEFSSRPLEPAIAEAWQEWGGGATNYGRMLEGLHHRLAGSSLADTVILILGDARNNHGEHRSELLASLARRSRRLVWLNPEPRRQWGQGDSEMLRYEVHCHQSDSCRNLADMERVFADLLAAAGPRWR